MASTLKATKTKRMKSALFRQTPEKKIAESLRVLRKLRDAEWMVSTDWTTPAERHAIIEAVDDLLSSKWAQSYLKDEKG